MEQLHIVLLPMITHGHTIPMVDMAKLFTSRGLKITIISTPVFSDPIIKAQDLGFPINLITIKFPPEGSDLLDDMVSFDQMTSPDLILKFFNALALLQEPVEKILQQIHPNALISDTFLPWTVDSAAKFDIPRLVFYGTSYFAMSALEQMKTYKPYKHLSSDSDSFDLPGLPHRLTLVRSQVSKFDLEENKNELTERIEKIWEANLRSYGVVVNSFYELESDYVDYYRDVLGRKAWHVGPLLLSNKGGSEEKALRGKKSEIDAHKCLAWLDSKRPNSVVYVCFGSMASFTPAQLREKAIGLEGSGQDFIWVVRRKVGEISEEWLPEGFEERMKGRGIILRGWAPQVLILDHPAIGAFVTHCGWNSTLEGICAGVPMVTWPVFAEQFFNEKLVTVVLKTGVSVGNKKWMRVASEGVSSEAVVTAVKDVMVGKEAAEMRRRARHLKKIARKALEKGGSSYNDLNVLVEDLSAYSAIK